MSGIRYFSGKYSFWKFEPGKAPLTRPVHSGTWEESIFTNVEEFLADTKASNDTSIVELTAEP